MVAEAGLDSRACGRLVARGHNAPPERCSVPLVLQVLPKIKNTSHPDGWLAFLVAEAGLEPATSGL